jgi:uncharacterized protein (TIGR00251 family)
MDSLNWRDSPEGVIFPVKLVPRARHDEIVGVEAGTLKVRVSAPPLDGKANSALVKFLSAELGVKQADVEITRGANVRFKTVRVRGVTGKTLEEILQT